MTHAEVDGIFKALNESGLSQDSSSRAAFSDFLCRVLEAKTLPRALVTRVYTLTHVGHEGNLSFSIEEFLTWYMCSFAEVAQLRGDQEQCAKVHELSEICEAHGIIDADLEKIHKVFKKFDTNASGCLSRDEFVHMIMTMLGARGEDVSKKRLDQWWREIDVGRNEQVKFPDFANWYLKLFGSADSGRLEEAFHESFNPSLQRINMLIHAEYAELAEREASSPPGGTQTLVSPPAAMKART